MWVAGVGVVLGGVDKVLQLVSLDVASDNVLFVGG
ncbi:hypothetical protein FRC0084_00052 [Corynebacterium diphtheriae]|nr:hypothetical protein CIP107555_02277 [Corynebacterium diphtheriae]CAB0625134.1 hypothetical protein CIP107570_00028 [Corynebacterium diphtheriae]CAB0672920.1 hypothetical protein FRC0084_00052 [Corynebacterium diphtheriae]